MRPFAKYEALICSGAIRPDKQHGLIICLPAEFHHVSAEPR